MPDYSKMDDVKINKVQEPRLDSFSGNEYDNLCDCTNDCETCLLGTFLPCCLFGITYERADLGSLLGGCCKYLSLHLGISFIIGIFEFNNEWQNIYGPLNQISDSLTVCKAIPNCQSFFEGPKLINDLNQTNLANNNCNIPEYLHVCKCLNDILPHQCEFFENMPLTIKNTLESTIAIYIFGDLLYISTLGLFLSHYRQKISEKFNIQANRTNGFIFHCLPCINPCALCQEATTVNRLKFTNMAIMPINSV